MRLYNNSSSEVVYNISNASMADCGTIAANDTIDLPAYDNQTDVVVAFSPAQPNSAFRLNIPETKPGQVVTVGIYQE